MFATHCRPRKRLTPGGRSHQANGALGMVYTRPLRTARMTAQSELVRMISSAPPRITSSHAMMTSGSHWMPDSSDTDDMP